MNRLFLIRSAHSTLARYVVIEHSCDNAAPSCVVILEDYIRTNLPGLKEDYTVSEVDFDASITVLDARSFAGMMA